MNKNITLAFCVLLIGVLACGSSNTGVAVPTSAGQPAAAVPATSAPQKTTFAVGEMVQVQDHTITLNSAEIDSTGLLKVNFSAENKGAETLNMSSLISFEAKDSEGTKLEQDYMACSSSFDGEILAGDKLKGDICWQTTAFPPFKIYYKADLLSDGSVVWVVAP